MKTGRPAFWNPVASLSPEAWTDVVALTSKDRVGLPVVVRDKLAWLTDAKGFLGIVDVERFAELRAWEPDGADMIEELKKTLAKTDEPRRGELLIAAMDRFLRLTLDGTGRAVLPPPLVTHLEANETQSVRIVMRDDRLWLWSERHWQAQRAGRLALFSELNKERG
jgi:DNA-binding transcriptional regulator/RsmH inhibitor MraZ